MTTKEQERKALEQIRKIVEGLGKDSYLSTAFEGAFEDAEYNIRDDAAYSMKSRWESVRAERDTLQAKVAQCQKTIREDNAVIERHAKYIDQLEAKIADMQTAARTIEKKQDDEKENAIQNWNKLREAEEKLDEKEEEIIHLKAKLYDMMTK